MPVYYEQIRDQRNFYIILEPEEADSIGLDNFELLLGKLIEKGTGKVLETGTRLRIGKTKFAEIDRREIMA